VHWVTPYKPNVGYENTLQFSDYNYIVLLLVNGNFQILQEKTKRNTQFYGSSWLGVLFIWLCRKKFIITKSMHNEIYT
jgi:hypothetical protein